MQLDYIVDAEEMQRADRNTTEYFKMPQLVLMERAACAAMEAAVEKWPQLFEKSPRILIAAGNGNNGGDGAAFLSERRTGNGICRGKRREIFPCAEDADGNTGEV